MISTATAQTFDTRGEALAEIAKMNGWPDARPVQVIMQADEHGNMPEKWLIRCGRYMHLQVDGFVR